MRWRPRNKRDEQQKLFDMPRQSPWYPSEPYRELGRRGIKLCREALAKARPFDKEESDNG